MTSFFPEGFPKKPERSDSNDGTPPGTPRAAVNPFKNPLVITVLLLLFIGLFIFVSSQVWTEVLWYKQVDAERVLWTRWLTMGLLWILSFAVMYLAIAFTAQWGYRKRPLMMPGNSAANLRGYQQAIAPIRNWLFWGIPALIAFGTSVGMSLDWEKYLMWVKRVPFGQKDPQFGLDLSFYIFTVPVLQSLLSFLFSTAVACLIAALIVNYIYGGIGFGRPFKVTPSARLQIGLIAAVVSILIGLRYWLSIYTMLYESRSDLADGALFTDLKANIPAQMILAIISLLVSVLFVLAAFKGTWRLPVTAVAVTIISGLVIGGIYPAMVQQFKVTPNARELETPYIQRNIDATLKAYGLDDVEYTTYAAKTDASAGQLREDSESTSQIRLLDPAVVSPTFRQLQQSRPYYTFETQLAVDRYTIDNEKRDTVIAVRDLNLKGLSDQQQTWVNRHTVYTHGFGVVAAYGNAVKGDGNPAFWESSIPSEGEIGDYEERVYFSSGAPEYSIVGAPKGSAPQELDYPDDNAESGQVQTTFTGDGGPNVGSWWNKLLYAVKFASTDIFFSSQTNPESQILYHRDPLERVARVAPFLTLEQKAYPAVVDMDGDSSTPKRLVWIIDGYTTSDSYPYSQHQSLLEATTDARSIEEITALQSDSINYIRNSVKAVVDAYDGSVSLYAWDTSDPLLKAWEGVYPGLMKPMSQITGDLMSHLRYPEDLFKVQRSLLTTYHVTEAAEFYTGGDRWRLSEDPTTGEAVTGGAQRLQAPYYLTMQMPGQKSAEFSLTSVYVPAGAGESRRAAMAGFLAVDSETGDKAGKVRDGFGKLRMIALPSSTTVPGPGQVQNAFNSDQQIGLELNLLNTQGSNVIRGNLLTLPVGGGLLYVQPVYIQSTGSTSYPVLRYVLTAFGDQIGFARTLEESLDQTFGGDSQATVTGTEGDSGEKPDTETDSLTLDAQLNQSLLSARDAMKASQQAMKDGDWTAYGKAQQDLTDALEKALNLQNQIDGGATAASEAKPEQGGAQGGDSSDQNFGDLGQDAEDSTLLPPD